VLIPRRVIIRPIPNLRFWSLVGLLAGGMLLQPRFLPAEPVAVHHIEGTVHGFLMLRTVEGKTLAAGDLIQITRGSQVISRLVFRFRDGSVVRRNRYLHPT
jgi:hypothetical protein